MPTSTRRASVSFTAPEHFPNALAINCRPGLNPVNLNGRQMFSASIRSPPRSLNPALHFWPCMFLCSVECLCSEVSSPDLRPPLAWITFTPVCICSRRLSCLATRLGMVFPLPKCKTKLLFLCVLLAWCCRLLQAAKGLAPWWHDVRRPAGEKGDVHWHVSVCTCMHAFTHNQRKWACTHIHTQYFMCTNVQSTTIHCKNQTISRLPEQLVN